MFNTIFVQPILNLLVIIYSLVPGGDLGVAIIIFTLATRILMWPLVKKQFKQARAMQKIQAELPHIKKEAKGNKQMEGLLTMELYKKHQVNPFGSIGVMLVQFPVFIALFSVIRIFTFERDKIASLTYGWLKGFEAVKNIINHPDLFNEKFLGFLDITKVALPAGFDLTKANFVLLALAIFSSVTQYIMTQQIAKTNQQKQPDKKLKDLLKGSADGKDLNQAEINTAMMKNMNKVFPIMMFLIMVRLQGALTLYYTTSNLIAVIQQKFLAKQLEAEAEAETVTPANKKPTAKERAKNSTEATIVRIKAKETPTKKKAKK